MILRRIAIALSMIMLCLSAGCSPSEKGRIEDKIMEVLSEHYVGRFNISDVEIKAFENVGTSVDPEYKSRFVISLEVPEATYERVGVIVVGDISYDVVRMVLTKGSSLPDAFGKSTTTLRNEELLTQFDSLEINSKNIGELLGFFSNPVVEDSDEHEDALASLKKWKQDSPARLKRLADKFNGEWTGFYICRGEPNGFVLKTTVNKASSSKIEISAVYEDIVVPGSGGVAESFSLIGSVSDDGYFSVKPKDWINHNGGNMAGFSGQINSDLNEVSGKLTEVGPLCTSFNMKL